MTVDYDGKPYPRWYGKSATVTIHSYDDDAKLISATIEAIMFMEGSNNTRNIKIEMRNLNVSGEKLAFSIIKQKSKSAILIAHSTDILVLYIHSDIRPYTEFNET